MSDEAVVELSEEEFQTLRLLEEELAVLAETPGALIPALQRAQNLFGYVPKRAMELISERLGESMSRIFGVVTFYSFFSRIPRGKYMIRVCMGTACYVLGAQEVVAAFSEALGIKVGGTTRDRQFSLEVGRCFGACGLAPVIMVNDDVHQRVKPGDVLGIIEQYRNA